jgi:hypothetical protein
MRRLTKVKPLPFRGGVGVGLRSPYAMLTAPTPIPSPEGEVG